MAACRVAVVVGCALGTIGPVVAAQAQDSFQLAVLLAQRRLEECQRNAEREALVLTPLLSTRPTPPDDLLTGVQRQARVRQQCQREETRLRAAEEAFRRSIEHVP
jgi:hypothetical protein